MQRHRINIGILGRDILCQFDICEFADRIGRPSREYGRRDPARQIDDRALFLRAQKVQEAARHLERALDVDFEVSPPEICVRGADWGLRESDARVVDQDVGVAVAGFDGFEDGGDGGGGGDVGGKGEDFDSGGEVSEIGCGGGEFGGVAADEDDGFGVGFGEGGGEAAGADAVAGAGDDDNFAGLGEGGGGGVDGRVLVAVDGGGIG